MWIFTVNRWTTWNILFKFKPSYNQNLEFEIGRPDTLGFLRVVYSEVSYLETSREYDRCDDPLDSILE